MADLSLVRAVRLLALLSLLIIAALPLHDAMSAAEPRPFPPDGTARSYFAFMPPPPYPKAARYARQKGKGWFELIIDFPTGRVEQVKVLKSTGSKLLDDSTVATFLQWRAKPRVLHHAVLPVEFGIR